MAREVPYKKTAKYRAYLARYRKTAGYRKAQRKWSLKRRYGITIEQYQEMLVKQSGGCAICGSTTSRLANQKYQDLFVDHNHVTKAIRGLLCQKCNAGIGYFDDKPALLRQAIQYLERN